MPRGKPVELPSQTFANQKLARQHFAAMLKRYKPGERVSEDDAPDVEGLFQRHPEFKERSGNGIDHFEIQIADFGSRCFRVVRKDGTWDRFSYKKCTAPLASDA